MTATHQTVSYTVTPHQTRIFTRALLDAGCKDALALAKSITPPMGLLQSLLNVGVPLQVVQDALLAAEIEWCEPCAALHRLTAACQLVEVVTEAGETEWWVCRTCLSSLNAAAVAG